MFTSTLFYFLLPLASLATRAGCQDLVAALEADPELSTLLGAIGLVEGLADTLDAAEGITIFAPTNDAFAAVAADSREGRAIADADLAGIASLLSYHVVPATINSTDITETPQFVQTLLTPGNVIDGGAATLVPGGQYLGAQVVDGAVVLKSGNLATSTVTEADIVVGGATIHKIDSVLTIPTDAATTVTLAGLTGIADALTSADLLSLFDNAPAITAFVPVDAAFAAIAETAATLSTAALQRVLLLHLVVGEVVFSTGIPEGETEVATALGEDITLSNDGTTIEVNGNHVVQADVLLSNGVAHLISGVLLPE